MMTTIDTSRYCLHCDAYYNSGTECPVHRKPFATRGTHQIVRVSACESSRMPLDLAGNCKGDETYAVEIDGHAQRCHVRITAKRRAGVVWGGNATWIDLRPGEGAEDAARIVLNDPEETERRA